MLINIEDIKIKKRVRKDLGDLEALKNSLRIYGLLNPITLNSKYELIAGERRLQAAKQLGWTNINAVILSNISDVDELEMELEDAKLKGYTPCLVCKGGGDEQGD